MGLHQTQIALESIKNVDWKDKEILDIGCSDGTLSLKIMKTSDASKLIGVDFDSDRINKAKKLTTNDISFFVASAEDLSQFPDNSFDGIFCNMAFQQFSDFTKSLQEFKKVLKPGCFAIINFNEEKSPIYLQQEIIYNKLYGDPNKVIGVKKRLNSEMFSQISKEIGFSNIEIALKDNTYYYNNFDEITSSSEVPFFSKIKNLSKEQEQMLYLELIKYLESTRTSKGIPETWKIIFAKLRK